ncbi:MAG: hypothetical protein HY901_36535 [Deltaproteobacteria bacterium]|nr:hypothetical protein [Deltaproteobacteria bacterium]
MRRSLIASAAALVLATSCDNEIASGAGGPDAAACPEAETLCGSSCVALALNDAHCGACGHACTALEMCAAGSCYPRDCPDADCSTEQVCLNGACIGQTCVGTACTAGETCFQGRCEPERCGDQPCLPGSVCVAGTCSDARCVGVVCAAEARCAGGRCLKSCTEGESCSDNPGAPCLLGAIHCQEGMPSCVDTLGAPGGTACGSDRVCDGEGDCVSCVEGVACTSNPGAPCLAGQTSCSTGHRRCVDGAGLAAGTVCGTNQVCDGAGACVTCLASVACATNFGAPCKAGRTECSTGVEVCVDGSDAAAGLGCGTNQVCDGAGACVACAASIACETNPGAPCKTGRTECSTGEERCVDGLPLEAGTGCGMDQVCDGLGACVDCAAGSLCATNLGAPCLVGIVGCSTGAPVCLDGAPAAGGTSCGTHHACNGAGICVTCQAPCAVNPDPCKAGVVQCTTEAAPTCIDGSTDSPDGTDCGTLQVCLAGACAVPDCANGFRDGSETGADCGGGCASKCADGLGCLVPGDCQSGVCLAEVCAAPDCHDGVKNGTETATDCGGDCLQSCLLAGGDSTHTEAECLAAGGALRAAGDITVCDFKPGSGGQDCTTLSCVQEAYGHMTHWACPAGWQRHQQWGSYDVQCWATDWSWDRTNGNWNLSTYGSGWSAYCLGGPYGMASVRSAWSNVNRDGFSGDTGWYGGASSPDGMGRVTTNSVMDSIGCK